jgi:ferrous iron transport protein B
MLVVLLGVAVTLAVSALLSRTALKGEASAFTLELPPYRRPNVRQIMYTSLIDRTIFVLWRAVGTAVPAGAVIWLLANISAGGNSLAGHASNLLDPLGHAIGLDGGILLAYIIAIPANEIVLPTLLMIYTGAGAMTEIISADSFGQLLIEQQGWSLLTAVNLMLFSLLHNPCGTAILTIWKETRSLRWTILGTFLPLSLAFGVTFVVAQVARLFGAP